MSGDSTRQAFLAEVRAAAVDARDRGDLPAFLGELESVRVEVLMSLVGRLPQSSSDQSRDRLLTVSEVARRIGRSRWWVYQNKDSLPMVRLPSGRYGFSEHGLNRWIARRAAS